MKMKVISIIILIFFMIQTVKSISIFGPEGYAQKIASFKQNVENYKKYFDDEYRPWEKFDSSAKAYDILEFIKENGKNDIKNNIPLRSYLAAHGFYPNDKIYETNVEKVIVSFNNYVSSQENLLKEESYDPAYQKYLADKKAEQEEIKKHLSAPGLSQLVQSYSSPPVSYRQWQENNKELVDLIDFWTGKIKALKELLEKKGENLDINTTVKALSYRPPVLLHAIMPKELPLEVIKLLIDHGANVNAKSKNGWTPLEAAIYTNNKPVVELLISKGARINERDDRGRTILTQAKEKKEPNKDIIDLLIAHGATS